VTIVEELRKLARDLTYFKHVGADLILSDPEIQLIRDAANQLDIRDHTNNAR
jgi:hypothetical protein